MGRPALENMDPKYLKAQKRIGVFFMDLRDGSSLSKLAIAKKLGVSSMTVANWEVGKNIGLNAIWKYAKFRKISFADFLGEIANYLESTGPR